MHNFKQLAKSVPVFKFEHPNREEPIDNRRYTKISWVAEESAMLHGFAGFFESQLYADEYISINPQTFSDGMFSWFEIYFPIITPTHVKSGDEIVMHIWRCVSETKVCVCVCLIVSLVVSLVVCVCVCLFVCLSLCLSVSLYLSVPVALLVSLYVGLSVCVSDCLSVCLIMYADFLCLIVCLSFLSRSGMNGVWQNHSCPPYTILVGEATSSGCE